MKSLKSYIEAVTIMNITNTINETREQIKEWKKSGYSIGFVPTMGALHEGHQSLIQKSADENDKTVVSIFVNPMQFAPSEDLGSYPRDFKKDAELCGQMSVDLIFSPNADEMYASSSVTFVDMDRVTKELCGKSRPSHFRGVCTVVNKLFNIIMPDRAYFGQKDAQQLAVISRMVRDLDMDVEIVGCQIVREDDGLAKSSRNAYLNPAERSAAMILSKSVFEGERLVMEGERNPDIVISAMHEIIKTEPLARIDYIEIVDSSSIEKVETVQGSVLVAIAVFIGKTRLIDNFIAEV